MKKLVIIGVGGFGREVAWLVSRINKINPEWDLVGFVDDNKELYGERCGGNPVLGDTDWLKRHNDGLFSVCAIANAQIRKEVIKSLGEAKFATLIDPSVILSEEVKIEEGSIICAGTILTVDIRIGKHVIINWDCTVGHDAELDNFVTLYPGVNVSGNVHLEECVEMGTGSQIIQGLYVGAKSIVGAGAVVVKNITEAGTYVGAPARKVK